MSRFLLYVSITFITAFVGVSWAARGFPLQFGNPLSVEPAQPTPVTTFRDDSIDQRRERLIEEQMQDPENAKRNPLRADALQAATGYALSPCDETMKANLIAAVQAYAAVISELIPGCHPLFTYCKPAFVDDKAQAIYSTPFDLRVRRALHEAFEKGGITKLDFPPKFQIAVMSLASSQGSFVSACGVSAKRSW
jgi:hypothetical protein